MSNPWNPNTQRAGRGLPTMALTAALCLAGGDRIGAQNTPPDRSPARLGPEPQGALPFDLAFDAREFLWSSTLSVSRDGRRIAYVIRQSPGSVNLSTRFQPNGTPSSVVGAKVYLSDRGTPAGRAREICPGGSCWAPSLSPNGETLAFYSDKDGTPQLWVFDVATARVRKAAATRIKAKLWTGDEPQWSPDGR